METATHFLRFTFGGRSSAAIASCAFHLAAARRQAAKRGVGLVTEEIERQGQA